MTVGLDLRGETPCQVLMSDGSWEVATRIGEPVEQHDGALGALVQWQEITAWLFRRRGRGRGRAVEGRDPEERDQLAPLDHS